MLRAAAARAAAAAAAGPRRVLGAPSAWRGLAGGKDDDGGKAEDEPAPSSAPPTDDWRSWAESRLAALTPDGSKEAPPTTTSAEPAEPAPPPPPPPPPPRATIIQPPPSALPSPFTGYAELGGDAPSAPGKGGGPPSAAPAQPPPKPAFQGRHAAQRWAAAAGRVHPNRFFYPGQHYAPADLVVGDVGGGAGDDDVAAFGAARPGAHLGVVRAALPPATEIKARADFRDAKFLASLLTETGRLPPRRRTRLSQAAHRHVARQVKLARQMALLHPLTRAARADGGTGRLGGEEGRLEEEGGA